jgi:hypothetical protein
MARTETNFSTGEDSTKETQLKETQLEETQLEETQLEETQLKETQLEETQVEKTYVRVMQGAHARFGYFGFSANINRIDSGFCKRLRFRMMAHWVLLSRRTSGRQR